MSTASKSQLHHLKPSSRNGKLRLRSSHFTFYSKHYLSNVWIKLLKFSFAFNLTNVYNLGSSVSVKIHVPDKDHVSRMLLKLPIVCKYTVIQTCRIVYENAVWLLTLLASVQKKYAEDHHHHEPSEHRRDEQRDASKKKQQHTHREQRQRTPGRLTTYVRSLKWTPIPVSVGFALLAYQHYRRVVRRTTEQGSVSGVGGANLAREWEVTCYRMVPLRAFSRAWGWVHSINLPIWARTPLYSWYAEAFNCNVHEAEVEDLQHYRNLGEFFRRGLKSGVRPICYNSSVVSPVDGTILHCGRVECGNVEQVKGVSYSLPAFLGPQTWSHNNNNNKGDAIDKQQYCTSLLKNKDTALFHCVIYLAPGDYHRFHSPAQWNVQFRRHFAGELLSVNPVVAKWIAGLFSLNERAVYIGEWEHGFFSYTAVGATNVGSIRVYEDKDLSTNCWHLRKNTFIDKKFSRPIALDKGDNFGEFNLGSTIVLLFEAPADFEFTGVTGSKINLGQSLFKSKACESQSPPQSPPPETNPSL